MSKQVYDQIEEGLLELLAKVRSEKYPTVTHPDGKRFYRNSNDQWLPL